MVEQERFGWRDLNPVCVLRRLLQELPIILLAGLIAAALLGTVAQLRYEPEYTAVATVSIKVKSGGTSTVVSNQNAAGETADTLNELFNGQTFSGMAKEVLGMKYLPSSMEAEAVPETNLIQMKAVADSPEKAFSTLRCLLDNYTEISSYAFENVVMTELISPKMPTNASNTLALWPIRKKAFVLGAGAMVLIVLLLMVYSDTVQTSRSLERKLDAKLVATIHHEEKNKTLRTKIGRANKGLLLTTPNVSFQFTEEIHKLGTKVESAAQKNNGKVILVTSTEENEGKSTVAANLAITLAQEGKRVLLIDADLHKAAQYKLLSSAPRTELVSVLRGEAACEPDYLKKHGFYAFLSRRSSNSAAELISSENMKNLLDMARQTMDFVIVDSPPVALFSDVEVLADQADLALLVVRQDMVPASVLNDTIDTLNQSKAELLGCVFNDVRSSRLSTEHYGYGYGYSYGYGYGYGIGRKRGYGYSYGYGKTQKHSGTGGEPAEDINGTT